MKGFALLATVAVISTLTAVAIEFSYDATTQIRYAQNFKDETQAKIFAEEALKIVIEILEDDLKESHGREGGAQVDFYSDDFMDIEEELWSKLYMLPQDVGYAKLWASVVDEGGKLNINVLRSRTGGIRTNFLQTFERFFENMEIDPEFLRFISDWLCDDRYCPPELGLEITPRNGPFFFLDEIRMVHSWDDEWKGKIFKERGEDGRPDPMASPYITLWPLYASMFEVNINTAPVPVLLALSDKIDESLAEEIVERRKEEPFKGFSDIRKFFAERGVELGVGGLLGPVRLVARSNHFSCQVWAEVNNIRSGIQAVIHRGKNSSEILFFRRL